MLRKIITLQKYNNTMGGFPGISFNLYKYLYTPSILSSFVSTIVHNTAKPKFHQGKIPNALQYFNSAKYKEYHSVKDPRVRDGEEGRLKSV